jgi:hypothetical protein
MIVDTTRRQSFVVKEEMTYRLLASRGVFPNYVGLGG